MWLEKIGLLNFKNYENLNLNFSDQINCLVGENGSGKTNLLDAIYYLSLSKSAFSAEEFHNIRHGADFFSLKGEFHLQDEAYTVQFSLQRGKKKEVRNSKINYEKINEHIGLFPVVLIAPNDTDIIREGSENRRKFFDGILSQIDAAYLEALLKYNYLLKQRNSLLKQFTERNYFDYDLLESYDHPLILLGNEIYEKRKLFNTHFQPIFLKHYNFLSEKKELVRIEYQSDHETADFPELFKNSIPKDRILQRTSKGIHKDDYLFEIDGFPIKKFGSQGQQKSFLIALKLAQFEVIKNTKETKPILLLDDIFDKLDDLRIKKLTQLMVDKTFGQLFITDARPERTLSLFGPIDVEKQIVYIKNGITSAEL